MKNVILVVANPIKIIMQAVEITPHNNEGKGATLLLHTTYDSVLYALSISLRARACKWVQGGLLDVPALAQRIQMAYMHLMMACSVRFAFHCMRECVYRCLHMRVCLYRCGWKVAC